MTPNMYVGLLKRSVSATRSPEDCHIMTLNECALKVDGAAGQLLGFYPCVQKLHKSVAAMLVREWDMRQTAEGLATPITLQTLSLFDVASFVLTCARHASM